MVTKRQWNTWKCTVRKKMEMTVWTVRIKMNAMMTIETRYTSAMKVGKCHWAEWMTIVTSFKIQDHAQKGIVSFCT